MSSTPPPPEPGRLRPTRVWVLAIWAIVALVAGWLLHPLAERGGGTAPIVSWAQPALLGMVALILGGSAWITYREVHVHRRRLEAHRAVNRLVMARACAYVGAVVLGGYAGYGGSWVGIRAELAEQRMVCSFVAAAAGLVIVVTGLLLERACRVRGDDPEES